MQIGYTSNVNDDIAVLAKDDIYAASGCMIRNMRLIRAKKGVHVYNCEFNETPAVVKYFENEEDKREIENYHILTENGIPTINILAFGESSIVMEDISVSDDWRLGVEEDLQDAVIAESLARWYFNFHEKGLAVPELDTLYCEYDSVTKENIVSLCDRLPEAADTFRYIVDHCARLTELIATPAFTLTYNDFYWTNFIVRKDKQAAVMFDYNLLGRGYRYADIRNVGSLSENAYKAFNDVYNRLYAGKYGKDRSEEEYTEKLIDDVVSHLFSLISAYEMERFPDWANEAKNEALSGALLYNAKKLLD